MPSGDLPNPGIKPTFPMAPALQVNSLLLSHQGSPYICVCIYTHTHTYTHRERIQNEISRRPGEGQEKNYWGQQTLFCIAQST